MKRGICIHCGKLVWLVNGRWDEALDTQILGSGQICSKNTEGGHEVSDSEKVVVRLNDGRDFSFGSIDEATLRQLGPAILSHLGCSFQIVWPVKTDEDRERREQDRTYHRQVRREKAQEWASAASVGIRNREVIQQLMEDAYKAGWDAAPKPVGYQR